MSNKFYTSVFQYGNSILYRGLVNGMRVQEKIPFRPTLFVNSKTENKYRNLKGRSLEPVGFADINSAKDFVKQFENVTDFPIYGNTSFAYQYISENFPNIEYDMEKIKVVSLDIEVESEMGFPDPEEVNEKVLLITIKDKQTKAITTFGVKPFDVGSITHFSPENYTYVECQSEVELFQRFLTFWSEGYPDVVTGWNTQGYDLPYLINRGNRILPENEILQISPWRIVKERRVQINNREVQLYDIYGIASLDYLDLYKKFGTYSVQESYKLDYIARQELGRQKLENPHNTYRDFYSKDWQLFVEYNVVDTDLVDELEEKMRLIELAITMAYDAKCNYTDVYHAVRLWDCILYNHLRDKNIVPGQRQNVEMTRTIEGGYVKNPTPGRYNWLASFDAASLYPSIIMQWNMSPETFQGSIPDITVERMLAGEQYPEVEFCMAANGTLYSTEKRGLFPEIVERIFDERVFYKKKMIAAEKEYEKTHDSLLLNKIAMYKNIQMAKKIQLNSLYGAMANQYFRFYDDRIAEGVTMTGQFIIRSVGLAIDEYLNKFVGTTGYPYTFYQDTDSCYVTLEPIIQKFFENKEILAKIDIMDKLCVEKLQPAINKACEKLALQANNVERKIFFKRESLVDTAIWTGAKKRYAMNVYDQEGVRYNPPKVKVTGMESNRSSTPEVVRDKLKEALRICLTGDEGTLQQFVANFKEEFSQLPAAKIAFPRGVNGMDKYSHFNTIYIKGTPIHVRAALLFNHAVKAGGLEQQYEEIRNGDKIRFVYLKEPNPIGENTIAFVDHLPKEFGLERFVDYEKMFGKTFEEPITPILSVIRWVARPQATLQFLLGD